MQRAREEEGATTHSAGNVYWPFLLYERTNRANECTSGPPVDTPQKPTHRVVVVGARILSKQRDGGGGGGLPPSYRLLFFSLPVVVVVVM